AVVVDLAVEDDPGAAVLVGHGLMAAGEVDDGQAPHGEAGLPQQHGAVVVRAAVNEGGAHPLQDRRIGPEEVPLAADSAHQDALRASPYSERITSATWYSRTLRA